MIASLQRIAAVVLRHFFLLRGSATRVLPLFLWSSIDMVLWGFITHYLNGSTQHALNFVPLFLGGILLWDFLVRIMQGLSMCYMEDGWAHNFLNLFASPLAVWEYLAALVISSILTSAVGLAVMLLIASGFFGLNILAYGLSLLPFMLILFLTGTGLGILGCAIMLRLGPAAEWFVWPIPLVLSPFVGVFYPVAVLPGWMRGIAAIIPPTYVFQNVRRITAGGAPNWGEMAVGLALAALYIVLAVWVFLAVYRYARRNGLISRYSAETS